MGLMTSKGNKFLVWVAPHPDAHSTLIHEAVHVFQALKKYIGEDNPGDEFEAYSIEYIAMSLIKEYERALHDQRQEKLQKREPAVQLEAGTEEEPK